MAFGKLATTLAATVLLSSGCTTNIHNYHQDPHKFDPFNNEKAQAYDSHSPPIGPKIVWNSGRPYFTFSDNFALGMKAFGSSILEGADEHELDLETQSTRHSTFSLPQELEEAFLGSSTNTITRSIYIRGYDRDGNMSDLGEFDYKTNGPNPRDKIAVSN
ncbi:MAG: hypothetical protein CL811_12800 [Colwelliaceae bacterium]|nr:hypothetical protein [Colwelliaceae bacterium]|tara:strand:+ start:2221 stop:2700 length:480 start_codon:yes stop_codon:yes gene_type:complete